MSLLKTDLSSHVKENVILALREQGIRTVTDFITRDIEQIQKKCSQFQIQPKELVALRKVLLVKFSSPVINGFDLRNSTQSNLALISTGNKRIDELTGGGIYSGEVTEICGGIAVGKTQLCMKCVSAAGINKQSVFYIDTTSSFSATRTVQLIGEDHQSLQEILSFIKYKVCTDIFEIFEVLEDIKSKLISKKEEFDKRLKLVIIDCIASVVYPILGGNQIDGHGMLVQLGHKLKVLAVEFSVAVLITNNVVYVDGGKTVPSLGRTWSHIPHTRIMISLNDRNSGQKERKASLIKSNRLIVPSNTLFNITEDGE